MVTVNGATLVIVIGVLGDLGVFTGLGWILRRGAARFDAIQSDLATLKTAAAISSVTHPQLVSRVEHIEGVQTGLVNQVAVLSERQQTHDTWHSAFERRGNGDRAG